MVVTTGLLKGSTTAEGGPGGPGGRAERPKTLRRLRNVYEQMIGGGSSSSSANNSSVSSSAAPETKRPSEEPPDSKTLSILSPFDEQEEWAKISEIMASFGTGLVRESVFVTELEKEFQARLGKFVVVWMYEVVYETLNIINVPVYIGVYLKSGDGIIFLNHRR